jgi:hypothetical protein
MSMCVRAAASFKTFTAPVCPPHGAVRVCEHSLKDGRIGERLAVPRYLGTAAFGSGGNAASVIVPRRRSKASLSARSSFSSVGT